MFTTQPPEIINDTTVGQIIVAPTATPTATSTPTGTSSSVPTASPIETPTYTFTPAPSETATTEPIVPTSSASPAPINQIAETVAQQIEFVGTVTSEVAKVAVEVGASVAVGVALVGTAITAVGVSNTLLAVYQGTSQSLTGLPLDVINAILQKIWQYISIFLSTFFGFVYKKRQKGGTVFDATNNKPLSNAYIVFYSKSGNITSAFTDRDGTYEAELEPDAYKLRAERRDYIFPSKLVTVASNNLFSHIYQFDEEISVNVKQRISDISIPLDPDLYLSAYRKTMTNISHFLGFVFGKISSILAILSIFFSASALYVDRSLLNIIIFGVLTLLYVLRLVSIVNKKIKLRNEQPKRLK